MFPNDEGQLVDAAREHIEEAAIADGLDPKKAPAPTNDLREDVGEGSQAAVVGAAMEHIEDASVADGLRAR